MSSAGTQAPAVGLVGLYDRSGRVVLAPQFRELKTPLVGGVTVATTGTYKAVLIDTQGKTLASFDSLFPEYAEGDGLIRLSRENPGLLFQLRPE